MDYIIRLNPRAMNPLTKRIDERRLWEVEQCEWSGRSGNRDSEKVIWHFADVKINETPIVQYLKENKIALKGLEIKLSGIAVIDGSNAIKILTGKHDVAGA
jgi:hypothetical protein